jgi:hypothetical protein
VPRRPNLSHALTLLIEDIARRMPEFAHVRASQVLVVAGEARRASRGTVKPLALVGGKRKDVHGRKKPLVRVNGERMLYCITLRPLFFRASTAEQRVATVLHELFHISPHFDGTLDSRRRHRVMGVAFGRRLRPLVRRYLGECPHEVITPFAHEGEVRIRQWIERPGGWVTASGRRVYTEAQLFLATVRMVRSPLH